MLHTVVNAVTINYTELNLWKVMWKFVSGKTYASLVFSVKKVKKHPFETDFQQTSNSQWFQQILFYDGAIYIFF